MSKRSFSEQLEEGAPEEGPSTGPRHSNKKFKPSNSDGRPQVSKKWKQKRIRDIKRQLQRNSNMPATIRHDLEQEIQSLQNQKGEDKVRKMRSDMIGRYHMVRFFERQKATRRLKKFQRALKEAEDPEKKAKLEADVHMSEVDIAYTHYFPHLEPYISLWPKTREDGDAKPTESENARAPGVPKPVFSENPEDKPPMWHVMEKLMEEGPAALEKLRDRRDAVGLPAKAMPETSFRPAPAEKPKEAQDKKHHAKEKPNKKEVKRTGNWEIDAGEEEDDDGEGFFE
ncbi:rRNA-processing protein efg1 like [Verticillium longisporum]|uniref:rRNA-processing protein EFG1 n=1 Tax=Verticillium longisporum TaxID=100787 RepID=A0A8I2ZT72_VERLO|nr:rRNA-processing protein efg1 like [Verticillium longisporum]KAG7137111.1 rRNA-processing protein efg1 like [Verticillium longisporum]